jgi:hypothetical protein
MTDVQLLLPQAEYDTLLSAVNQQQGQASDVHIELDDGAHHAPAALYALCL